REEGTVGVVAGSGELEAEVAASGTAIPLGVLQNSEVPALMRAADLVILPSHREGMPTVLIEAGAARVPVLATRVGGIPELLGDDRGELFDAGDVRGMVEAIRRVLLPEDAEAHAKAERLYRFVQKHYNAEENAGHL